MPSWLQCGGSSVDDWLATMALPCNLPIALSDQQIVSAHQMGLYREMHGHSAPRVELVRHWTESMFRELQAARNYASTARVLVPKRFQDIHYFIRTHYVEALSLHQLAEQAKCSATWLCRQFHHHFGIAPMQLQISLRLADIAREIADTDTAIGLIAATSGYENPFTFSKIFNIHFGMSPLTYWQRGRGT